MTIEQAVAEILDLILNHGQRRAVAEGFVSKRARFDPGERDELCQRLRALGY